MLRIFFVTLLSTATVSAAAYAGDHTIRQKGRAFSSEALKIKKGDTITFVNDDNVPHNIMSVSSGNQFNLGSQTPGASTAVTVKQAGDVTVTCAIHPRMKMTVTVTD